MLKQGDGAAFKYAERGAFPGSILPRYVRGVGPCPCFLGHRCDLVGSWERGGRGLGWARGSVLRALLGTCWGSWAFPICLGERSVCSGTSSGAGRVSACKGRGGGGVAVVLADPPAHPGSGFGVSSACWQAARRGFGDVLLGSPGGSQRQGRSCRALKPSAWEGRGAALQPALAAWGDACQVGGALRPVQTYPSACSGFSKQPRDFPNISPHLAGYLSAKL